METLPQFEWTESGLELLRIFNKKATEIGYDILRVKILREWSKGFTGELRDLFIEMSPNYSIRHLAEIFELSYCQVVEFRRKYPKPKRLRFATRKTNRCFVQIFDTETGIFYETQSDAAFSINIPRGSTYQYMVDSCRFIRINRPY